MGCASRIREMAQKEFPDDLLEHVAHRPYPVPDRPWVMTQSWHDLLFAHWPVDTRELRQKVPPRLEVDLFDGQAWLSITPFRMTNVAPRGVPALPRISAFPEINVRTYVRLGDRPGIYFFSLDAGNSLAVRAARAMFHLPYFTAAMSVETRDGQIHYQSERRASDSKPAVFTATYRPLGEAVQAQPTTLGYFLTERYCLYTFDERRQLYRGEIHHPPWTLQIAAAEIATNTMAEAAGLHLPAVPPLLHFSRRQDVVVWLLQQLS